MTSSDHIARCQEMRGGITESEAALIADLVEAERLRDRYWDLAVYSKDDPVKPYFHSTRAEVAEARCVLLLSALHSLEGDTLEIWLEEFLYKHSDYKSSDQMAYEIAEHVADITGHPAGEEKP